MKFFPFVAKKGRVTLLMFLAIAMLGSAAYTGNASENVAVMNERGINIADYEPFKKGSKLAVLKEPSTLQLTQELPRIDSATALYPLAAAFVQAVYPDGYYADKKQSILTQTTTRRAFDRLANNTVDIVFAYAPSKDQIEYAKTRNVSFALTPIGKEAFVFFVNAKNPVNSLTIEQIRDIYSGKITNWKDVGGEDSPIKPFQREASSGSQTRLEHMMEGRELLPAPYDEVKGGMGMIILRASDYKNHKSAIGFSFRYYATDMVKNKQIKLLNIDGVPPTRKTIKNGSYPLINEFYAVTRGNDSRNLRRFINWILSPQGQYLIEKTGYVGID